MPSSSTSTGRIERQAARAGGCGRTPTARRGPCSRPTAAGSRWSHGSASRAARRRTSWRSLRPTARRRPAASARSLPNQSLRKAWSPDGTKSCSPSRGCQRLLRSRPGHGRVLEAALDQRHAGLAARRALIAVVLETGRRSGPNRRRSRTPRSVGHPGLTTLAAIRKRSSERGAPAERRTFGVRITREKRSAAERLTRRPLLIGGNRADCGAADRSGDSGARPRRAGERGDREAFGAGRPDQRPDVRDCDSDPARRHLAEDALQGALITAWRQLPTLRDPDRFEAWLRKLLVHACYAEARRRRIMVGNIRVLPVDGPAAPDRSPPSPTAMCSTGRSDA